jgi:hypothetical protein
MDRICPTPMAKILENMKYGEQIWLLNRALAILT